MITHIIHGSDISKTLITALQKHLTVEDGILKFIFHSVDDLHLEAENWIPFDDLFEAGRRFRSEKDISDKDIVYTLTERSNAQNYFASLDPTDMRTGFLHAGDWDLFIDCDRSLPIAFTILNMLVGYFVLPSSDRFEEIFHQSPIGCVNDFCDDKREVIFKLRTGDVCTGCIRSMQQNGWSDLKIDHAMRILSALSIEMRYNAQFQPVMEPSGIHIDMKSTELILPDYEFLEIPLQPVDLTFYLFYLRYAGADGLYQIVFEQQWAQDALFMIYKKLRPMITNDKELRATAKAFADLQVREQARARIKKIFTSILGPRLAKPYLIQGARGEPTRTEIPMEKVRVVNFQDWEQLPERP